MTSAIGLVARNQRRYGGYIVHLGIVLMALGFAGEGFKQEEQLLLKPGQSVSVGTSRCGTTASQSRRMPRSRWSRRRMTAFQGGKQLGPMTPAKWFYNKRTDEPTTEVAIRQSFAYDLYVVLAGFDAEQQSATFHVVVNPLVNWIWAGFGILAFGTLIALLPERAFAVASVNVPRQRHRRPRRRRCCCWPCLARCVPARGPCPARRGCIESWCRCRLEREIQNEIICMCGTAGAGGIDECTAARRRRSGN